MIKNKTKRTTITTSKRVLYSSFQKAIGLMFAKKPESLIFAFKEPAKISLHMFFVFFPIDVLYIGSNGKVVEMKENFKPFTFYSPKQSAKYVIELPKGTIQASKTQVGDSIEF